MAVLSFYLEDKVMNHNSLYLSDPDCFTIIPELEDFAKKLTDKYGHPVGSGINRTVWKMKNNVIKLPRCEDGIADNDWEASVSGENLARTRYIVVFGFPVCVMEYVDIAEYDDVKDIDWTWSVDCCQVGYNKKGVLKAFDFGYY